MSIDANTQITVTSIIANSGRAHPYVRKWMNRTGTVLGSSKNNMLLVQFRSNKGGSVTRSIPAGCVTPSQSLTYAGAPRLHRAPKQKLTRAEIIDQGRQRMKAQEDEFEALLAAMDDPLDDDGYPTEQALRMIELWPMWVNGQAQRLLDFVESIWHLKSWGWHSQNARDEILDEAVVEYHISTAGWSGNEAIIGALQNNWLFWSVHWVSSRRGGHYVFQIAQEPEPKMQLDGPTLNGPRL